MFLHCVRTVNVSWRLDIYEWELYSFAHPGASVSESLQICTVDLNYVD